MAGIYDYIKDGKLKKDDTIIFLHTGGTPALFAYVDEFESDELCEYLVFDDR